MAEDAINLAGLVWHLDERPPAKDFTDGVGVDGPVGDPIAAELWHQDERAMGL